LAAAPPILRAVAARLREREREFGSDSEQGEVARRALYQLYQLTREG
jgi:hypothetical protein